MLSLIGWRESWIIFRYRCPSEIVIYVGHRNFNEIWKCFFRRRLQIIIKCGGDECIDAEISDALVVKNFVFTEFTF